jgi:predicted Zn finger-like uncharacterized protein
MPEQVECPSCKQKLRVPDNLLGKKVKCPKCATVFDAVVAPGKDEEEGGSYAFTPEPEPQPRSKALRRASGEDVEDEDELDQEDEIDNDEDEDERPQRKKKKKGSKFNAAKQKVAAPGICLIVLGSIGVACALISVPTTLLNLQDRFLPPGAPARPQAEKIGNLIGALVMGIIYLVVLLGGIKMKNLESYRTSLIVSILCLFPCTCCFVAIPFGIWSLVVINSQNVRPYFKS